MKIIDGGVTSPKGFKAAGLRAGIKAGKTNKDMAMVYSEKICTTAGTYTRNLVKAAPVLFDKKITDKGQAQAVVVNSGIANACTGEAGYANATEMSEYASKVLGIDNGLTLVASTGVIGYTLPMDIIKSGIDMLVPALKDDRESAVDAATAIMTTDTHKKEIAYEFTLGGVTCKMGAMCKGSGMIHPNMGTMLGFITTDVAISSELLSKALKDCIEDTFNMVTVDGDTSTNDTVLVLANGMSGNAEITSENSDYEEFKKVLFEVNKYLAKQIAADGEGATKLFECTVVNADTKENAKVLAKSVVMSNLTKCAVYGNDANVGRIACAMGYSGGNFDPEKLDVIVKSANGETMLLKDGLYADFSEEEATNIMKADAVTCICDVKMGDASATAWGCDLTHEYVNINADYRS